MKYFIFAFVTLFALFQQLVFCADSSEAVKDWMDTNNKAAPLIIPWPDACPLPPMTIPLPTVPIPVPPIMPVPPMPVPVPMPVPPMVGPPIFPPYPPPPVFPPYPPPPVFR